MSNEYLKLFNDVYYTLSNKLSCLVSSHINININFDHKLKEINSLIAGNELAELNLKRLGDQLSDLHSMLDMKLKYTEEVNRACCKKNKMFSDLSNEHDEVLNNPENIYNNYLDVENVNCDSSNSKVKLTELNFSGMKMCDIKPSFLAIPSTVKKIPQSRYSEEHICNSLTGLSYETGPLLRKNINFNMKSNKHKTKKFLPFKKQGLFKNSNSANATKDRNILSKNSNSIRLSSSNDTKYFTKKRKRLSLSNSLFYGKRTRNQPNKTNFWDHEDTRVYCICNKPSYGDMIACDSEKCKIEWFHYKCVDITTSPKGDWYCPMCKID